ncbi:hypothetical protein TREMEDRAFT_59711 [Tremella mesenterica DSM 1558]|uniref:uncharacterized protein n=1 Tax=Tremella mesenterica (strain ATCC 24925 / CBS 8224 / DSM 1558 / NBRC 9311 / NRRL Y-6157 / RJB 2259-6 / UBC 559-6) TaxID=578456 RepID=UPI0003F48E59|nr:uncharacterized protein TREMEDRAFT_59711 [Tremella mesenterica DSM 1558]EIW73536.1 hypothetical protein TREMEDRAFT_59711 [Tremella mesenterica DSM 1558]
MSLTNYDLPTIRSTETRGPLYPCMSVKVTGSICDNLTEKYQDLTGSTIPAASAQEALKLLEIYEHSYKRHAGSVELAQKRLNDPTDSSRWDASSHGVAICEVCGLHCTMSTSTRTRDYRLRRRAI